MVCEIRKIDSNVSGLAFAEEECLKQLPDVIDGSGLGDAAVWFGLEPNSYSDFGGEPTTLARSPISQSRQNKKGVITDVEASGGFNIDFTQNNLTQLMQGFFFADARQQSGTKNLNFVPVPVTAVTTTDDRYAADFSLNMFELGMLVKASGFTIPLNNGVKVVDEVNAAYIGVSSNLADETPPVAAKLEAVGRQFAAGDISLTVTSGIPALESTVTDFTTMDELFPGAWVFLGGDLVANRFANNVGFARVNIVEADRVVFDDTSWAPATESGAGKTIHMFFGITIKNESLPSLIKRRSYQIERTLGEDENGTQSQYLVGAVANELTLNIPEADKINADLTFIACDDQYRNGTESLKDGDRVASLGEDAFNTSSNVYRIKLSLNDPSTSNPSALFGYVTEANIAINNGVTPNKAIGVIGAFDTSAANFEVTGTMTAYFQTVEAVRAVRNNADIGLSMIATAKNAGFLFDIPLMTPGGGRIAVEKDAPITIPLENSGAENKFGHTMLYTNFPYLPNLAMPT